MTTNNRDIAFDLADTIYFDFMDTLDNKTRVKFVKKDIDNKGGTINTEKGRELYYLIEDKLLEALDKWINQEKNKVDTIHKRKKKGKQGIAWNVVRNF